MGTQRAHILLPQDLLKEIDDLVGPRGRSAFLVETARAEVRRQKLLKWLESKDPFWHDSDHPELAEGADVWVHNMRQENDARLGHTAKLPSEGSRPKKRSSAG